MAEEDYKVEEKPKKSMPLLAKLLFGTAAAALIGVVAYPVFVPEQAAPIETSEVQEFQETPNGSGFARIEAEPEASPAPGFDFARVDDALAAQQSEADRRNAELLDQVKQLEFQLNQVRNNVGPDQSALAEQIAVAVAQANEANAKLLAGMQNDFKTELDRLTQENRDLEQRIAMTQTASVEEEMARLEAERLAAQQRQREAELKAAREEQQRLLELRVKSPSVVYDEKGASSGSQGGGNSLRSNASSAERNLAFMDAGASSVEVTTSEFIANPSKTIVQGTMIGATLENAVNSALPGNVIATVNEPVWSFDGAEILVPSGSRVFGSYSSDIELGQGRILVRWSRIVTPEGQSVQIAAFGGDEQGRSGISGHVNTRFGARFGGAALISLIGALPAVAAAEYADDSEIAQDTAEDIGDNFGDATDSVLSEYASLPPIISVSQGAQVSIMVDRDLEFF